MKKIVKELKKNGLLKNKNIADAFLKIDRKDFILPKFVKRAHKDHPLPIGYGQTISQPTTVALMLEWLEPKKGEKILDIGSGSGWTTALLAEITGKTGKVFGLEIIPKLVRFGKKNLKKYGFNNAEIVLAGENLGIPEEVPFDKILVSAASQSLPEKLVEQLKIGGILVIPVKNSIYKILRISELEIKIKIFTGFLFVPLIEKNRDEKRF